MTDGTTGILDRWLHRAAVRRWVRATRSAPRASLASLRAARQQARELVLHGNRLISAADSRLAQAGNAATPAHVPVGTQWAWRPEVWCGPVQPRGIAGAENRAMLGTELQLFHDCSQRTLSLQQIRNAAGAGHGPYGLRMDVFQFDGSFLSLVVNLPEAGLAGLDSRHLVRLTTAITTERPVEIFGRLNLQQGPNTAQLVLQLATGPAAGFVEFDLAYGDLSDRPIDKVWLDVICGRPEMNRITLRDVSFCRYARAAL